MSKKKVLLRGVFINRDTNGEGVLKVGTTLIRVSTVMGILYSDAEHLNINGMEKMTEYLGKYIINKYDVSSEKSTGDIVKWNKCVKKTKEMINSVREDMKSGTCRLYYEASIYWEPKIQK